MILLHLSSTGRLTNVTYLTIKELLHGHATT